MRSLRTSSLPSIVTWISLLAVGLLVFGYYLSWWFTADRLQSPWLLLGLLVALCYGYFQILGHWILFLLADLRPVRRVQPYDNLSVDVFVTACGEDHALVRKCLAAAYAMRGKHQVWLLDDGRDPALQQMAKELGAGYLTRDDRKHAKAGNLNSALARTDGDIIAIFDVDHVPVPEYLEATLPHFADPTVGFVQVMLTFRDGEENWVEQAATESSFGFYNPTSNGMDRVGSVTMMGSNSLIRRDALASIGNYQPGLAEDLATSFALHRSGWRSAYVAEPLAPGLAPPDLMAWFTQQFKWARGVFEVLLTTFPRLWEKLTWGDRIAYGVRMTMYWLGPIVCLHVLVTLFILLGENIQAVLAYEQYLLHLAPLACFNVLLHGAALRRWMHPSLRARVMWKAVVLVYITWPVYTLAWIMALLRIPLAFRPTPKTSTGYLNPWWLVPQLLTTAFLVGGVLFRLSQGGYPSILVLVAAIALAVPQVLFFWSLSSFSHARTQPELSDTV